MAIIEAVEQDVEQLCISLILEDTPETLESSGIGHRFFY